jgi:hypothetical protein
MRESIGFSQFITYFIEQEIRMASEDSFPDEFQNYLPYDLRGKGKVIDAETRRQALDEAMRSYIENYDWLWRDEPDKKIDKLLELGVDPRYALQCAMSFLRQDLTEKFLAKGAPLDAELVRYAISEASKESLSIQDPMVQDDKGYKGADAWNAVKYCAKFAEIVLAAAKREDLIGVDVRGRTLSDWAEVSDSSWLQTAVKSALKKHGLTEDDLRGKPDLAKPYIGKHRKLHASGPKL